MNDFFILNFFCIQGTSFVLRTCVLLTWKGFGWWTEWMKNQREPSAGREATSGHGKTVAWNTETWVFMPYRIEYVYWTCVHSPTGRSWRKMSRVHSRLQWRRSYSSPRGKGEYNTWTNKNYWTFLLVLTNFSTLVEYPIRFIWVVQLSVLLTNCAVFVSSLLFAALFFL